MTGPRYYAVPDPADPGRMTYWRLNDRGDLSEWPVKARYAPALYRKDVPAELTGQARREWVRRWYTEHTEPWWQALQAALAADWTGCARRFADLQTRCCICGRRLTDPASKVYGIGPECRTGAPDGWLAAAAVAVGRAHAAHLVDEDGRLSEHEREALARLARTTRTSVARDAADQRPRRTT